MTSTTTQAPGRISARLLRIYANDHLAVSTGALELARRMQAADRWAEQHAVVDDALRALAQDVADVRHVLAGGGLAEQPLKQTAARVGERLGRFKLNGHVVKSSPLTRLIELEGLQIALEACRAFWLTLAELGVDPPLAESALARLERQREAVTTLRPQVVPGALRP